MSTTPEQEVPSVEDRLAGLFMAEEEAEAPQEDKPEPPEDEQEADDAPGDEPEAEPEDEAEEVEFDGKAYKVPKELKGALLRQQDYTRKTQEVAELRKAAEERATYLDEVEQIRTAIFDKATALRSLEAQLESLKSVDLDQLELTDPAEARRLERRQRQLQERVSDARNEIQNIVGQERQKTEQARQQLIARGSAELSRDIKGWGPELAKEILTNGTTYGFNEQELTQIIDPRFVKALHDAYQWRKLQAAKPGIEKKASTARPMKAVSRSAPQAQRESAAVQARTALKKSGRAEHAEAFFESMFKRSK